MGQTMGNIMNPNVANPQQANWGDLDPNEKFARIMAGSLSGLGKGLNQQYNPTQRNPFYGQ